MKFQVRHALRLKRSCWGQELMDNPAVLADSAAAASSVLPWICAILAKCVLGFAGPLLCWLGPANDG